LAVDAFQSREIMAVISSILEGQLREQFDTVIMGDREVLVNCDWCPRLGKGEDGSGVSARGHLSLNFDKNVGRCHRCGFSIANLRKYLLKKHIVAPYRGVQERLKDDEPRKAEYREQVIRLPAGCLPISGDDRQSWSFAESLYEKNISPEQIVAAQVHYATDGKAAGYCVFPFFEDEELVYWQGRAAWQQLLDNPRTKKRNPFDETIMGKSSWLYGVDDCTVGGDLFLCEGTLDRISLHDFVREELGPQAAAVSLQGTSLGFPSEGDHWLNTQFGKIIALEPRSICVLFDPDAYQVARRLADELQQCGFNAYAGRMPDHRDPNEAALDPDALRTAIQRGQDALSLDSDLAEAPYL
jgi:hypothetical protein